MGVKVPEIKYDFWCECDIRGTKGTKREKYGEKYSDVNAALALLCLVFYWLFWFQVYIKMLLCPPCCIVFL